MEEEDCIEVGPDDEALRELREKIQEIVEARRKKDPDSSLVLTTEEIAELKNNLRTLRQGDGK